MASMIAQPRHERAGVTLARVAVTMFFALAGSVASTEDVVVKYRGVVNLNGFACRATSSSLVHRICYRADAQYLVVLLESTYYHYCRIPQNVVSSWLGADSLGRFYNANVKGRYDCRDGGVPDG
jgi:hypothetical protein